MKPFDGAMRYLATFHRHLGYRIHIVFVLALLAAATEGFGITLLLPLLSVVATDIGGANGTPHAVTWVLESLGVAGSLTGILLLIGVAFVIKGVIAFAYGAYGGRLNAQLQYELETKMFKACSEMSYSHYVTRNTGHFVNVIIGQVASFSAAFEGFKSFVIQAIKAVAYLGVAMLLAWRFGIMAMATGVIFLVTFRALNAKMTEVSRQTSHEQSVSNKLLVQGMQAFKYLVSTNSMGRVRDSVSASSRRLAGYRFHQQLWAAFATSISEPLSVMLIIAIVLVQVKVLGQPLAPILVAIVLFHRGMGALLTMQSHWLSVLGRVGSIEMVESEFAALEQHREHGGDTVLRPLSNDIRLEGVTFGYGPEMGNVLSGVDLRIPARTTVALVGESGAGKSTLVDLITLMLRPNSGTVRVDGVPAREIDLASWRNQIGYVSQETVMFDDTVAANIAMCDVDPHDEPLMRRIRESAQQAHIETFIDSLPDGYLTTVGDRGVRLSGGQRQRLFIARELFRKPSLLILDEATSALDSESEQGVQRGIDALHGEMTVVIIAHRLATVRNVDKVFVFANGRLIEQGDYESLRSDPTSRFSAMVEMQTL